MKGEVFSVTMSARSGGIGSKVPKIMFFGFGNLCEDSCNELEAIEGLAFGMGREGVVVRALGFVEEGFGTGSPMDTGEADGAPKQVAGQPLEPCCIFRPNGDRAIRGKATVGERT